MIDGVADRMLTELKTDVEDSRTPLQAANIPVMNRLAEIGLCGVHDPV